MIFLLEEWGLRCRQSNSYWPWKRNRPYVFKVQPFQCCNVYINMNLPPHYYHQQWVEWTLYSWVEGSLREGIFYIQTEEKNTGNNSILFTRSSQKKKCILWISMIAYGLEGTLRWQKLSSPILEYSYQQEIQ